MDIPAALDREHSKVNAVRIAAWVGRDTRRLRSLMAVFLAGEYTQAQRSAMVVDIIAERSPALLAPYLPALIARMAEPGIHMAVRRCVVRMLQEIAIPRRLLGRVTCSCFEFLADPAAPIAIKAFAMGTLERIARMEPGIRDELRLVIEQQLPHASAGFRARARMVLKSIAPEKQPPSSVTSRATAPSV